MSKAKGEIKAAGAPQFQGDDHCVVSFRKTTARNSLANQLLQFGVMKLPLRLL